MSCSIGSGTYVNVYSLAFRTVVCCDGLKLQICSRTVIGFDVVIACKFSVAITEFSI